MSSATVKENKYFESIGRRKTSRARVRLFKSSKGEIIVNSKALESYFPIDELQKKVNAPLQEGVVTEKFKISVLVKGGGQNSQAEAVRHGIARALILYDEELRKKLKKLKMLKRDPRMKERRKFGLKKARKAPQWSKR
jgi:small subunit ribosomal protein S9